MTTRELKNIEYLNNEIDQLAADAGDVSPEAKALLDLAWWYTEHAIREETGKCSAACAGLYGPWCPCCAHYRELTPQAQAVKRMLSC